MKKQNHFQYISGAVFRSIILDRDENNWFVHTNIGTLENTFVLLATGAAGIFYSPSWLDTSRSESIGAAQVMTNVHRVQVGKKGIIIGANILSFAILSGIAISGNYSGSYCTP